MPSRSRDRRRDRDRGRDRGSVTAEFAIAMPAVLLVLALSLTGIQVAGQQLRLQDAAAAAARLTARQGGDGVALVARLVPGASLSAYADGDLECITLSLPSSFGLTLTARSCALGAGR